MTWACSPSSAILHRDPRERHPGGSVADSLPHGDDLVRRPVLPGDRLPDHGDRVVVRRSRELVARASRRPTPGRRPAGAPARSAGRAPAARAVRAWKGQTNDRSRSAPSSVVASTGSRSQPRRSTTANVAGTTGPSKQSAMTSGDCSGPKLQPSPTKRIWSTSRFSPADAPGSSRRTPGQARAPDGIEQTHDERGRAADLVGLGRDVERCVELVHVRAEHGRTFGQASLGGSSPPRHG